MTPTADAAPPIRGSAPPTPAALPATNAIHRADEVAGGAADMLGRLQSRVGSTVVGYAAVVRMLAIALVTQGHVLLEGTPGIAKTLLVRRFAESLALGFKRIQFTPDMLPSDIVGAVVLNPVSRALEYRPGPIFANVVLADEINRAPPKVQSALLEAMQERQVTIDGTAHPLPEPFIVIATQNPIEQEGTYPLPEAELDRLLFRLLMGYPSVADERSVNRIHSHPVDAATEPPIIDGAGVLKFRSHANDVQLSEELVAYVVEIVRATRADRRILIGASPRAGVQLSRAAKAQAMFSGRTYVTPDDVKSVAFWVLNHRVALRPELVAQHYADGGIGSEPALRAVLSEIFDRVPAPR